VYWKRSEIRDGSGLGKGLLSKEIVKTLRY
jgi:hypothetical protein